MHEPITAVTLYLRLNAASAEAHSSRLLVTRSSMQRKACWPLSHKIDMIDSVLRGFTCTIYMIAQPEKVGLCSEGEDWVFDGAHKLESVFEFMNDGFALEAGPTTGAELNALAGKKFSELPASVKIRIRQYAFMVNWIAPEIAADPDQRCILWERLNRAGVKLNDFELSIPAIAPLIETVLLPSMELYTGTTLFPGTESKRGSLERSLQVLLALIDMPDFKGSQNSLVKAWHTAHLGDTMAKRAAAVATKGSIWLENLVRCHKILLDLKDLAVFCNPVSGVEDSKLRSELARIGVENAIDIAISPGGLMRWAKKLVVMDVDSTLIQQEVIELLGAKAGKGPEITAITESAMRGELDFAESLRARVSLLSGLSDSVLTEVQSEITLTPGARTLIRTLHKLGHHVALVSGGF
jgi:hypothetical protein